MSTGVGNRKVGTLWHRVSGERKDKKWVRFGISTHIWVSGVARVLRRARVSTAWLAVLCWSGVNVAEEGRSKQPLKAKHIVISSHVEHCLTFPQGG